jgi:thioredoxin 1
MKSLIAIITLIVIIVGIVWYTRQNESTELKVESSTSEILNQPTAPSHNLETSRAGSYEDYATEKLAFAEDGDVVLFFHATWCPTCRALSKDIDANISFIPLGTHILKTDYDSEMELKKKYGVTTQHTLVQVDASGALIKKWTGGLKLSDLLSNID